MDSQLPAGAWVMGLWTFVLLQDVTTGCSYVDRNSPALDHEFIHGLGAARGRGETVPTVHLLH